MWSELGEHLRVSIFGQSHAPAIGVVMDGLPAGERVDLEALEEYPDTVGIFCTNENVTESVLETVGRLEDKEIKIVGFDAGEAQIQAIRDGREYGTVCQNPYGMGYAAVVAALRAASGQTVDNWIDPGYQWVDRSNIDVEENKKYLYL